MSEPGTDPASQTSGLGWPLASLGGVLIAAITAITVTGHDASDLINVLSILLSSAGAAGGIGAWVNSTKAARQTNGVLDGRMDAAVQRGIAAYVAEQDSARRPDGY